jgi:hypothetical protein
MEATLPSIFFPTTISWAFPKKEKIFSGRNLIFKTPPKNKFHFPHDIWLILVGYHWKIEIKIKIEQVIPFDKTLHSMNPFAMGFKGR